LYATLILRCVRHCVAIGVLGWVMAVGSEVPAQSPSALPGIQANSNQVAGGTLTNGVLTLRLELREANWYPETDSTAPMKVFAFQEEGRAPQVPGPLVRAPQGTLIKVRLHNLLAAEAVVHGLHSHPGDPNDVIRVPSGEVREVSFSAGAPGTYQYWASAGGPVNRGRPFREDSQLAGAYIVDPAGDVAPDRVFVIGLWRSQRNVVLSQDVPVINGRSWPYTERLEYKAGEPVRWRVINATDSFHPMHLHGAYYRVDSMGDGEQDRVFEPAQQRTVVTQSLVPGETMSTFLTASPGKWLFHCHLSAHFGPEMIVENALHAGPKRLKEHGMNHMAGLVMGITVVGERAPTASHGTVRKLRLVVGERPAQDGLPAGFGYELEEGEKASSGVATAPGPPVILERGRPTEITVVNHISEPTAVHWHGMELESYYDGVVGWGSDGSNVTPSIEPQGSFCARFTPPRAGTFIYHTHMNDEEQLGGGLYGALIVLDPGVQFDPATDHSFVFARSGPDEFTGKRLINGNPNPAVLHWRKGELHRLRLVSIAPNNPVMVTLSGPAGVLQWRALAKDGADLPAAQAVTQSARQVAWVGETYDFEYQSKEPMSLRLQIENIPDALLRWQVAQQIQIE
jgi:manganese oxidase